MADVREILLIVQQTVEHRVSDEIDLDEVLDWLRPRVDTRAPTFQISAGHLIAYLESQPGWKHRLPTLLIESTEQEPVGEELTAIQWVDD